jgi:hypothetical protein
VSQDPRALCPDPRRAAVVEEPAGEVEDAARDGVEPRLREGVELVREEAEGAEGLKLVEGAGGEELGELADAAVPVRDGDLEGGVGDDLWEDGVAAGRGRRGTPALEC